MNNRGSLLHSDFGESRREPGRETKSLETRVDGYFSADVETDGPIPGPFSMLSFAIVYAGTFDGIRFQRPPNYDQIFYKELMPISENYQEEALRVNGLDRVAERRSQTETRIKQLRTELRQAETRAVGKACVYATGSFGRAKQAHTAIWICLSLARATARGRAY
jgi:hypothetical protein